MPKRSISWSISQTALNREKSKSRKRKAAIAKGKSSLAVTNMGKQRFMETRLFLKGASSPNVSAEEKEEAVRRAGFVFE